MFGVPQRAFVVELERFDALKLVLLMIVLPIDEMEVFDGAENDLIDDQLKHFLFGLRRDLHSAAGDLLHVLADEDAHAVDVGDDRRRRRRAKRGKTNGQIAPQTITIEILEVENADEHVAFVRRPDDLRRTKISMDEVVPVRLILLLSRQRIFQQSLQQRVTTEIVFVHDIDALLPARIQVVLQERQKRRCTREKSARTTDCWNSSRRCCRVRLFFVVESVAELVIRNW